MCEGVKVSQAGPLCGTGSEWLCTMVGSCPFPEGVHLGGEWPLLGKRPGLLAVGLRPRLLLLQGLSRDSAKRLRFVPGVVYVDGMCSPFPVGPQPLAQSGCHWDSPCCALTEAPV